MRIHPIRPLIVLAVAAALSVAGGCRGDDPLVDPGAMPVVVATFACGPADGPATAIQFSSDATPSLAPNPPSVIVMVQVSPDKLGVRTWAIGDTAGATYHRAADDYESATGGSLTITSISADRTIDGSVALRFPGGRTFVRTIHAKWSEMLMMCG